MLDYMYAVRTYVHTYVCVCVNNYIKNTGTKKLSAVVPRSEKMMKSQKTSSTAARILL